jgi:hypothetical protein
MANPVRPTSRKSVTTLLSLELTTLDNCAPPDGRTGFAEAAFRIPRTDLVKIPLRRADVGGSPRVATSREFPQNSENFFLSSHVHAFDGDRSAPAAASSFTGPSAGEKHRGGQPREGPLAAVDQNCG